ncbi:MAG: glycosyltransferase [Endomicrobiia bacterium]
MNTLKELKVKNKVIFYIITSLDYGGTQRQLYILLKTLKKNYSYKIFLISLKRKGRFRKKFEKLQIPVYDLSLHDFFLLNFLFFPFALIKLIFLFFKQKPEIIHSFLFQANIFARFLKLLRWKTKLICSERVAEKQKKWQKFLLRFSNFFVDKITVNSNELKSFIISSQKIPPYKIEIIPNALLKEEFKVIFSPQQIRSSLGIKKDTFLVLSVGRLHIQKGYDLLLEVIKSFAEYIQLKKYNRDFIFIVVGDGEMMVFLKNYAKKLNVENNVKFIGYKENVYDYINASDLVLLTSWWEGSPNVVLESIYFKKPVISTGVEGVSDYLDKNYIVSLENKRNKIISEFTFKILEFYLDYNPENYKKCINKNFDINSLSIEKIIEKYVALYC